VQLDGLTLSRSQISTWATDAGYLDVLVDMVNRQGHRQRYEDLEGAAEEFTVAGVQVRVAGLEDIIASKERAGRPKDHEALPELYRLRARSTEETTPGE
jgi:predicted nucleotidyltransferase